MAWAAQELANRDRTQLDIYQEFVTRCEMLMAERRGEIEFAIPSFSSFNRYAVRLSVLSRRLEQAREMGSTLAARFDAKGTDDLSRFFQVADPLSLDGEDYPIGAPVALTIERHAELLRAGVIVGPWEAGLRR